MPEDAIDPFAVDAATLLTELRRRLKESADAVSAHLGPELDRPLESKAKERARRYTLTANNRHESIQQAAEKAIQRIDDFQELRIGMGWDFGFGGVRLQQAVQLKQLDILNAALTRVAGALNVGALPQALASLDPPTRADLGLFSLEVWVATNLVDFGTAFVGLHDMRRAALERYVNGKLPKGWKRLLPSGVRSVLTEGGYTGVEEILTHLLTIGFSPIPFGAAVVGVARLGDQLLGDRRRRLLAFRRGDLDDMLDLSDRTEVANQEGLKSRATIQQVIALI